MGLIFNIKYSKIDKEKMKGRKTMEEEKRKAYSEVVEILKLIEDEKRMEKIPFEVIELIKSNSDPTYKPEISKDIPLEEQNLKNETYSIMAWIANKYWGEEIEEVSTNEVHEVVAKESITEAVSSVDKEKVQENARIDGGAYNDIEPEVFEVNLLPTVIETKWYHRIKEKVIKLLKIIFKFGKRSEGVSE